MVSTSDVQQILTLSGVLIVQNLVLTRMVSLPFGSEKVSSAANLVSTSDSALTATATLGLWRSLQRGVQVILRVLGQTNYAAIFCIATCMRASCCFLLLDRPAACPTWHGCGVGAGGAQAEACARKTED